MKTIGVLLVIAVLCGRPTSARAQWATDGAPLCMAPGAQVGAIGVPDGAGGALIVWSDERAGPSYRQIYARRLTADGVSAPGWPDSGLRVTPTNPVVQRLPRIVDDGEGGMFVGLLTFDPDSQLALIQHIRADGTHDPAWPLQGLQAFAAVAMTLELVADGAGGLYAVSQITTDRGFSHVVRARRLTASGVPAAGWPEAGIDLPVTTPVLLAPRAAGGFLASTLIDGAPQASVLAVDAAGQLVVPPTPLRVLTSSYPRLLDMTLDGLGGAYVLLLDSLLYVGRMGGNGPVWPPGGALVSPQLPLSSGQLAGAGGEGAYVAWIAGASEAERHLQVQRIDPDGERGDGWPAGGIAFSTAPHFSATASPRTGGGVFVAWEDGRNGTYEHDVYVGRVEPDGSFAPGWSDSGIALCTQPASQVFPRLVSDGSGGMIVTWVDFRSGIAPDLYAARVLGDATVGIAVSLASADATAERVRLVWRTSQVAEARIERSDGDGAPWIEIARLAPDGDGTVAFEDRDVVPGRRYVYRLRYDGDFGEAWSGVVSIEVPHAVAFALHGARPNPAVGAPAIEFSLDRVGEVRLELLDVAGRIVGQRTLVLGPGRHVVPIATARPLAPGIYHARLAHAGRSATTRVAVTR